MLKLALPLMRGLDSYASLIERRRDDDAQRTFNATDLLATLQNAYAAYNATTPEFDRSFSKASLTDAHRDLLKELYGRYSRHLRGAVVESQARTSAARAHCQLCGIGEPGTLDHYLGKKDYGEFYVFPPNLVPSCSRCNSPRETFDDNGERRIVHLFADDVAALPPMITCVVNVRNNEPSTTFDLIVGTTGRPADLYRRHWKAIHLKDRYEQQGPPRLETIRDQNVARIQKDVMTKVAFAASLSDDAAVLERRHGPNHWEAALHRGAAQSDTFLAYCGAR
jgi:hypothetical protein